MGKFAEILAIIFRDDSDAPFRKGRAIREAELIEHSAMYATDKEEKIRYAMRYVQLVHRAHPDDKREVREFAHDFFRLDVSTGRVDLETQRAKYLVSGEFSCIFSAAKLVLDPALQRLIKVIHFFLRAVLRATAFLHPRYQTTLYLFDRVLRMKRVQMID